MRYRLLEPEEWDRLGPALEEQGYIPPAPQTALCAIAEADDGQILGLLFMQPMMHLEPLLLKTPHVNFLRLVETIQERIAGVDGLKYYCFSDQEIISRMAAKAGLVKLPYEVWQGGK